MKSYIHEENILGHCFKHKRAITKGMNKNKDYKCSGCLHSMKYDKEYWHTNPNVQEYLKKKQLVFVNGQTKSGKKTLGTQTVRAFIAKQNRPYTLDELKEKYGDRIKIKEVSK
jgi:heterodisulfide reductase subunit B